MRMLRRLALGGLAIALYAAMPDVGGPDARSALAQVDEEKPGERPSEAEPQRSGGPDEELMLLSELAAKQQQAVAEEAQKREREAQFMRYALWLAIIVMAATLFITYAVNQRRSIRTSGQGRGGEESGARDQGLGTGD